MKVSVRLFAGLRERAGSQHVEIELPDGAVVSDLLSAMGQTPVGELHPGECVVAINREYAGAGEPVNAGDEIALVPPVSGGAPDAVVRSVRVTDAPLDVAAVSAAVRDPRAGAVVTFSGVTREVSHLEYEAYAEMAAPVIEEIVAAAIERHGLCAAAARHRIGRVELGEPSVIVAASAPHRDAAFAGAREIIDTIKARAPIWKQEEGEWVEGTPPSA